jgi:cytochrome c oxidase subunit 2
MQRVFCKIQFSRRISALMQPYTVKVLVPSPGEIMTKDTSNQFAGLKAVLTVLLAGSLAVFAGAAQAEWKLNLQEPVTDLARRIYDLHTFLTVFVTIIFVGVFSVLGYSLVMHTRKRGHKAADFHDNLTVEILWTLIPAGILVAIAVPATIALVNQRDTSKADMTIKVTGYQWKWGYEYMSGDATGIKFMSVLATPRAQIENKEAKGENYLLEVDRHLVVPVNKKVRILTTATDVIHNWAMPAFAVKTDAVPGFVRDAWFKADKEGTYRGQCSELCGKDHGFMPIVVDVVSDAKYAEWVAAQQKEMASAADDPNKVFTLDELVKRGEKVYATNCAGCHQPTGKGVPPAFPALDGSAIVKGPKEKHLAIVINGKSGTAMAACGAQLNDADIASVVAFERNAWSNKLNDVIQPAEVKALRGK